MAKSRTINIFIIFNFLFVYTYFCLYTAWKINTILKEEEEKKLATSLGLVFASLLWFLLNLDNKEHILFAKDWALATRKGFLRERQCLLRERKGFLGAREHFHCVKKHLLWVNSHLLGSKKCFLGARIIFQVAIKSSFLGARNKSWLPE